MALANVIAYGQPSPTTNAVVPARSVVGMGGITTTRERMASPRFLGTELPTPPQQTRPWTIPASSLPTNYVTAAAVLFDQGLADPRGCDYRDIEVGTGNIWSGDGGVVRTRGWVFANNKGQQFAVCWNGLVYPTVSVGAQAAWRDDARACMQRVAREWRNALPESYEVSYETCSPLKGCLLLRLGEPQMAEDLWLAVQIGALRDWNATAESSMTNGIKKAATELAKGDPYLRWAGDWAWDLFERAVCSHIRGDDRLSLASARTLASARPKIEAAAEHRGFKRQPTFTSPSDGKYQDYLNFLGPLSMLSADQERRTRSSYPPRSTTDIEKMTNQTARIAAWIDALDQVTVRQWGQPGGLGPWEDDPVVLGLLKEGPTAIKPLLECLESDCGNRLTRSVSFGRDFHRGRTLHPVSQPIVSILLGLMNTSEAEIGLDRNMLYSGSPSNTAITAQFRSYWKEFEHVPRAERWYRKLADDGAGQGTWADALGNIVRAERVAADSNQMQLAGQVLRTKTSPSVTEILVRRCSSFVESANDPFATGNAVQFFLNTEKWETPPQVLSTAAQLQKKVMAGYSGTQNVGSADPQNATSIAALALLRARHNDTKGLDDYATWIQAANPNVLEGSALNSLEPFWRFPKHPALRTAAKAMLANTNSPWGTLAWCLDGHGGFMRWDKPLASPLLVIAEFRALVLNELTNRAVGGEAINRGGGNLDIKYSDGSTITYGMRKDTEGLEVGAKIVFRRCDIVVEQLSAIPGFPKTSFLWPEARRDEAVAATVKLLSNSGARLKAKEKPAYWSSAFDRPLVELTE